MGSETAFLLDKVGVIRQWLRDQFAFLRIQHEFGMRHSERTEDILLHEMIKRLSRSNFDHAAKHLAGISVAPERAGLTRERQFGESLGKVGVVEASVEQMPLFIELAYPTADI